MEFPFRKLLKCRHSLEPLAWWEGQFGRAFPSVQPFLIPCPAKRAEFYPCPDNFSVRLTIREFRKKYHAAPTGEHAAVFDDVVLDWEDVQAHQLGIDCVNEALRRELKLTPAAAPQQGSLAYIGRCDSNGETRHVFACYEDSSPATLKAVELITDPQTVGCILFSSYHVGAAELLRSRGISTVPLRECLSLKKVGFAGECTKSCQTCKSPSCTELSSQIESLHREKIEGLRVTQMQQKVIEDMAGGPDQFLAGLRAKLSENETVLFMALIYKEADFSGQRRVHSYAEIGKRLGKISKQAVEGRVRRFEKKHAEAWAYIEAIRHPKPTVPFSSLSPSERRKQGIDDSYNYDAR